MEFIFFLILLLQLFIGILIVKDILHPIIVLRITWILSTSFLLIYKNIWNVSLSIETIFIFLLGFAFFDIGFGLYQFIVNKRNRNYLTKATEIKISTINSRILLLGIILISSYILIISLSLVGSFQNISNFLVQLRYLMKRSEVNTSLIQFGIRIIESIGVSYILIYLIDKNKKRRKKVLYFLIIGISLIMMILSTGRYRFLSIIVMWLYIFVMDQRKRGKLISFQGQLRLLKIGIISVITFVMIFTLFGAVFFGKGQTNPIDNFAIYLSGGLVAFNMIWQSIINSSTYFGEALLAPVYSLIENILPISIGNDTASVLTTVYADNGFATNVYTLYRQQIVDFGLIGIPIAMFAIGFMFAILKNKSQDEATVGFWTLVYSYFMFGIITSPFQDMFFTNSTFHIFSITVFFLITKTQLIVKNK